MHHPPEIVGLLRDSPPISLLWVDDEVRPHDPAVRLLELEGFSVDVVQSGAGGIASALTQRHTAILLDLRLGDMDGLDVLQRLRAGELTTPVMVLSGFLDLERAGAATRLGAHDIRSKPLFADDLIEAVRALVPHARPSRRSARATGPRPNCMQVFYGCPQPHPTCLTCG